MVKNQFDLTPKIVNDETDMKDIVQDIISSKEDDDSFYVMDIGQLIYQYELWKENLPTVKPYYAVKCNESPLVLQTLLSLGTGFDCASKGEIKKVLEIGAKSEDIIFANPVKTATHLHYAAENGVSLMTFDSAKELDKIKVHFPKARVVLRIKSDATKASIDLGNKFGCDPKRVEFVIKYAINLGLSLVGISFHVGTGCQENEAYPRAIHTAAKIIRLAKRLGADIQLLDIGGGFPGNSPLEFKKIAILINEVLKDEKDTLRDLSLISEPGRYFATSVFSVAAGIFSVSRFKENLVYFVNNSVYVSFNCVFTEHTKFDPVAVKKNNLPSKKCIIMGQTLNPIDTIVNECSLPQLGVGDWILFDGIGAYSIALGVTYCGFPQPKIYPIIYESVWNRYKAKIVH